MLYESPNIQVTLADGIATLMLQFPGTPVNALSPVRMMEIEQCISVIETHPHLSLLDLRSGTRSGFCGGMERDAFLAFESDPGYFAAMGQRIINRLAAFPCPTLAYIEGPCLGPGLELALACDYRIAVAGPDSWFSFAGLQPCWGGLSRWQNRFQSLPSLNELWTAREAARLGILNDAFCRRRAQVEHALAIQRIKALPRKHTHVSDSLKRKLAEERRQMQEKPLRAFAFDYPDTSSPAERAIRGEAVSVAYGQKQQLDAELAEALCRGRVTPLEFDQARKMITIKQLIMTKAESRELILL